MRVRTRIVLLTAIAMIVLAGGFLAVRRVALGNVERLRTEEARAKASAFDDIVRLEGASLATLARGLAAREDVARLATTGDLRNAAAALDALMLSERGVDAVWIYRADGRLVRVVTLVQDSAPDETRKTAAGTGSPPGGGSPRFFIPAARGPLELHTAEIDPANEDGRRTTAPRGHVVVGRLWDEAYRSTLQQRTGSTITIRSAAAAPAETSAKAGAVRFSRTLPGRDGSPLFALDVAARSAAVEAAIPAAHRELLLLAVLAFVLAGIPLAAMVLWVETPLRLLSAGLDRQDAASLTRLADVGGEFGQLASLVKRFYEQKDELLREIRDRRRAEEQLRHDAFHDPVTGLANRALFMDRLENAMARGARSDTPAFAVLILDLDRFQVTNDSLGHPFGDQLLSAVSVRLLRCVRAGDLVARLGGDEFALLLEGIQSGATPLAVAERIQKELKPAFRLAEQEVYTSASIGIVLSSPSYQRPEELVRDADTAMYQAKAQGRAGHVVYNEALGSRVTNRLSVETDLRRAIERGELRVHYQPMIAMDTGRVTALEALVRWQHPERGLLLPGEFIPVAEECGLIAAVDHWVLREACRYVRRLEAPVAGGPLLMLAVNVSSRQFTQPGLVEAVEGILEETGFDPNRLRLEITESAIIENAEAAADALERLNALGIQICLDDFGTGYSSLGYLHRLPVDSLKIDRRFSARMFDDGDFEIVRTIVLLARRLGMNVVAEGVETMDQLTRLRTLDCQFAQGFLFSEPLDTDDLASFLATHSEWLAITPSSA
jgi:diguanylate cyclase (GGDEF)-like protein